jgi:hypothetical protein
MNDLLYLSLTAALFGAANLLLLRFTGRSRASAVSRGAGNPFADGHKRTGTR